MIRNILSVLGVNAVYRALIRVWHSIFLRVDLFSRRISFANLPRVSRKNKISFSGCDVYVGHDCHIGADVVIHSNVLIASNVSFVGGDHKYNEIGCYIKDSGRGVVKPIVVSDDVWIGHGAIVLGSVVLGRGSIVAAGSVVTKSVAEYAIVGGNPAKHIKFRFESEDLARHEALLFQSETL